MVDKQCRSEALSQIADVVRRRQHISDQVQMKLDQIETRLEQNNKEVTEESLSVPYTTKIDQLQLLLQTVSGNIEHFNEAIILKLTTNTVAHYHVSVSFVTSFL